MNFKTDLLQSNYVVEDDLEPPTFWMLSNRLGAERLQLCTPMPILYDARDRTQSLVHARPTLYQLTLPPAQVVLYTWEKLSRNAGENK